MSESTPKPTARAAINVDRNRELLSRAHRVVYKSVGDIELGAHIFYPENHLPDDRRPAAVFFFGGGWDNGLVSQFAPHCVYFTSRGVVAIAFDYRVASRHGTTPAEAMADACSAIRWVRENAAGLGVDPDKVIAVGASAGAHLVAAAAMIEGIDEGDEDRGVRRAPDAMVLFSPAVDISPAGFGFDRFPDKKAAMAASPLRHVRKGLPPAIVFHGTADRVVPHRGVVKFCKKMRRKRNPCVLVEFEGKDHGFFNFNVDLHQYERTMTATFGFLVEHGFIDEVLADDAEASVTLD